MEPAKSPSKLWRSNENRLDHDLIMRHSAHSEVSLLIKFQIQTS